MRLPKKCFDVQSGGGVEQIAQDEVQCHLAKDSGQTKKTAFLFLISLFFENESLQHLARSGEQRSEKMGADMILFSFG